MSLSIVFVAENVPGSRSLQRLAALRALGHSVDFVPTTPPGHTCESKPGLAHRVAYRLRWPLDRAGTNAALRNRNFQGVNVVWLDNAAVVHARVLRAIKAAHPGIRLVWFSEDDMLNPRHRSRWIEPAMALFDLWVTTKSFNANPEELPALGVRHVLMVDNAYDPENHFPEAVDDQERARLGADVGFIGTFEAPRAASVLALAEAGVSVRVWGNGWDSLRNAHRQLTIEGRPLYGKDYRKALNATSVNLCFLRRFNRDLQTTRSIEIPACGAFMLHERTDEMLRLFRDGAEAAYFDGDVELIAAAKRWLGDEEGRRRIAARARARVEQLGLSHREVAARILAQALGGVCES